MLQNDVGLKYMLDVFFERLNSNSTFNVPPMPLDTNENDSWKGNSSDSDINDATNIKSLKHKSDLLIHNSTPSSTYISCKLVHKCKKQKECEPKIISTGILSKKTTMTLRKNKMQPGKAQEQKRQINKIKKKKLLKDKFKSSRMRCNGQVSHVNPNAIDNSKDASYENGISYDNNYECLYQNILKINKETLQDTSQNKSIKMNNSIADFKHVANYQQIKPCFVKLNVYAVQNYILNRENITENKQNILHNAKFLDTANTLQIIKDISEVQNTIPRCTLKSKRIMKDINIQDKSNILHLVSHNSSEITPNYNKNIVKKTKKHIIKNSFVKIERLKIKEFVKKNSTVASEKEENIVSSTPVDQRKKPPTSSVILSPINSNIYDKLYKNQEYSLVTAKEDISNVDQKDSYLIMMSECYKLDPIDVWEQQSQVLLSPKSEIVSEMSDIAIENKITSYKDNNHVVITQKYKTKCNIEMEIPYSLNMSNQSQSLFDDMTYNYSTKATDNIGDRYFSDAYEFVKINTIDSCIDSKEKQLLNDNERANTSSRYLSSSKECITFRDNAMYMRQKCDNNFQESYDTRINAIKTVHENLENKIININKYILSENQDNINIVDARVLLTRLQDPIRIGRRTQYPKWHFNMSNICNSLNNEVTELNNEISHSVATAENFSNVQSVNNSEHSKNLINSPLDSELFDCTTQYNSTNKQIEKSVFLKPGKCWARSLSILNNVNDESDLDKLSIGKGKKWRQSAKDILDMQKRGIFQSCLKKSKDDTDLSSERCTISESNVSSLNSNRCKEFNLTNCTRFSKRISVRVELNNTSTKCVIKDNPFLEAFGITTEKFPSLKLSYQDKSLIHNDRITNNYSTIARDVVLQRCSQSCYMPFADCFPDSYLEYCHKIGEGVYGEVFLYEYDGKKSVIKIIPIENEQLVNGEPQKKFSEILSEVVIAKELDDLKLNPTYKTNGFVEVKNISCIIGKYPEKLVELWNIYDNDKTSDNDCPSMFGENQLYIALELGHGGEDLEAFVFQTAEEAYALFLQIALTLAIAEKALEFEHRDLHWGNVLVSRTKESYIYYNVGGKEIKFPSRGVKVSIIDFTLSRMLYQGCCIYNDLALDPALFTAHGEYQFEIYRLMREKIQNNWRKFEPYTNVLWLHYILDKMIMAVRYKKKNLRVHKHNIMKLKDLKDTILNYDTAYDFLINSDSLMYL